MALDDLAASAARDLAAARSAVENASDPGFRRFALDVAVQIDLGRFFAHKLRAGVLYALFEKTGDLRFLLRAVEVYRSAREAWAAIVERTKGVYVDDVSFGIAWYQRGHWADRLAAIDRDIEAMKGSAPVVAAPNEDFQEYESLVKAVMAPTPRPKAELQHTPPRSFRRGQPVQIEIKTGAETVRLHYRRTNQAEPWQGLAMNREMDAHRAAIPATTRTRRSRSSIISSSPAHPRRPSCFRGSTRPGPTSRTSSFVRREAVPGGRCRSDSALAFPLTAIPTRPTIVFRSG